MHDSDITRQDRWTLMSWLIKLHKGFKLRVETLFVCIGIVDQYTARADVRKCEYQLVGLTALFIASKYEEIEIPTIKMFTQVTDKLFGKEDIIREEGKILSTLGFRIVQNSIFWYCQCFLKHILIH